MGKKTFNILKCKSVDELFSIFELINGVDYIEKDRGTYCEYVVYLNNNINAREMYECVKDLDIYIPQINIYLSTYIFLQKTPTKQILSILEGFTVDDIFCHLLSRPRLITAKQKALNIKKK